MAKSIAKSCPLCLSVNDPVDMLPVVMPHSTPPQTAPLFLCRLCVIAIMKATLTSELVDPREVFGDVTAGDSTPGAPSVVVTSDETVAALVPENEPGAEAPVVDRRKSKVPAGGDAKR